MSDISAKDRLEGMCKCYGTFCGKWHSNEFWAGVLKQLPSMTEEECAAKIIQINKDADDSLAYWRAYQ